MKALYLLAAVPLVVMSHVQPAAADTKELISALKQGGYVLVFRHGATDESQKDIYPFKFDDMSAQRQLSDKGRDMAREMGAAIKKLGIPVGEVYTSRLNRAVETGKLLAGKDVNAVDALTDSSAGSTTGMANPTGGNAKAGAAVRRLVDAAPKSGTDTFLVTHKPNIVDAFGKAASDVEEGEALVYKASASGSAILVGRIKASEWTAKAAN